jgi:hypothetical protein
MLKINKASSKGNYCSKCARHQKQIARLNKAFIAANDESVLQCIQHEDEISDLTDECSYAYKALEDYKSEIKRLKSEHSSDSQSNKMLSEEVGQLHSNTNLRAPSSIRGDENGH